ncbi:MAG: hypothetical protein ABIW79_10465 [Gemmatimonas sp.]
MSHSIKSFGSTGLVRRTSRQLVILSVALGTLVTGCADPASPHVSDVDGPRMLKEVEGKLRVFNFTLRAIEEPNIAPSQRAYGHLQIKLTVQGDGSVRVAFKGQIVNPGGEHFTGFTIGNSGMGGRGSLFIALGEVDGLDGRTIAIDPEDATISAELAALFYGTPDTVDDPSVLVATFYTTEHPLGALRGTHALPAVQ